MKKSICLIVGLLGITPLLYSQVGDDESCNRVYQTAIKFTIDAPQSHVFTVSLTGTRVYIAPTNLQYCAQMERITSGRALISRDVFRFADRPFDRCLDGGSEGNVWYARVDTFKDKNGYDSLGYVRTKSRACQTATADCPGREYTGWTDLFPWGTSCRGAQSKDRYATNVHPYDTVKGPGVVNNPYGFGPTFYTVYDTPPAGFVENGFGLNSGPNRYFDWGYNNPIYSACSGTKVLESGRVTVQAGTAYRAKLWRSMTPSEWEYLFRYHHVESKDSAWTICSILDTLTNTAVCGIVFYPDDFTFLNKSHGVLPFGNIRQDPLTLQLPLGQWNELSNAGCVFIPATYYRGGATGADRTLKETDKTMCWNYWTPTPYRNGEAYSVCVTYHGTSMGNIIEYNRETPTYCGLPVRLVQDVQ